MECEQFKISKIREQIMSEYSNRYLHDNVNEYILRNYIWNNFRGKPYRSLAEWFRFLEIPYFTFKLKNDVYPTYYITDKGGIFYVVENWDEFAIIETDNYVATWNEIRRNVFGIDFMTEQSIFFLPEEHNLDYVCVEWQQA